METNEKQITITLPPRLAMLLQAFVQEGWFPDSNALILEALRRFFESHQVELMEHYMLQDVEWGLHGKD